MATSENLAIRKELALMHHVLCSGADRHLTNAERACSGSFGLRPVE